MQALACGDLEYPFPNDLPVQAGLNIESKLQKDLKGNLLALWHQLCQAV